MRKIIIAALASTTALAFMSDITDVVSIKGADGKPVRVNKTDFDADQASDNPTMTAHNAEAEPGTLGTAVIGGPPLAAPSAPNFGGPEARDHIDPLKNAVAPASNAANSRLVMKIGAKFFVVGADGEKLNIDGIDVKGYNTEEGAWQAVRLLPTPSSGTSPE